MHSSKYRPLTCSTGKSAEAQTRHNFFLARDEWSPEYLLRASTDSGAYIYVVPGTHTYENYHRDPKKLLQKSFVMEVDRLPPLPVFV